MLANIWDYFQAVREHWETLCAGGLLLLAELLELFAARKKGKKTERPWIPHWILRCGVVLCLFIAGFQAWREERAKVELFTKARPYFSEKDSKMVFELADERAPKDPRYLATDISLTNSGTHAAKNFIYSFVVVPQALDGVPIGIPAPAEVDGVVEVAGPKVLSFSADSRYTASQIPAMYILCQISYLDAETDQPFHQSWFFRYEGAKWDAGQTGKEGIVVPNLRQISTREKRQIRDYFKAHDIRLRFEPK